MKNSKPSPSKHTTATAEVTTENPPGVEAGSTNAPTRERGFIEDKNTSATSTAMAPYTKREEEKKGKHSTEALEENERRKNGGRQGKIPPT
jgi:hypothetical protein